MKIINTKIALFIFIFLISNVDNLFGQNKETFTFRIGYSMNKLFSPVADKFYFVEQIDGKYAIYSDRAVEWKSNYRLECNVSINPNLKIGCYFGIMEYPIWKINHILVVFITKQQKAPTFGIQFEYNIKDVFSNFSNHLDLYFTGKYGGTYLTKWGGEYSYPIKDLFYQPNKNKYRHEFGFGLGINYLFTKHVGLYTEFCLGQFSYFPDILTSSTCVRTGVVVKI